MPCRDGPAFVPETGAAEYPEGSGTRVDGIGGGVDPSLTEPYGCFRDQGNTSWMMPQPPYLNADAGPG